MYAPTLHIIDNKFPKRPQTLLFQIKRQVSMCTPEKSSLQHRRTRHPNMKKILHRYPIYVQKFLPTHQMVTPYVAIQHYPQSPPLIATPNKTIRSRLPLQKCQLQPQAPCIHRYSHKKLSLHIHTPRPTSLKAYTLVLPKSPTSATTYSSHLQNQLKTH